MNDLSIINFGPHKGKALANVPASYLLKIYKEDKGVSDELMSYIEDNLDILKKEEKEEILYK